MSLLTPTRFSPISRFVTLQACSTTFLVSIEDKTCFKNVDNKKYIRDLSTEILDI